MKRILFPFILAMIFTLPTSFVSAQLDSCQNFNDSTAYSWTIDQALLDVVNNGQNGPGDFFIRATDQSSPNGCSWLYNPTDFDGNYLNGKGCMCLCYDFRINEDSDPNSVLDIQPRFYFYQGPHNNPTARAVYIHDDLVNETMGWVTLTIEICPCTDGAIPDPNGGRWVTDLDCEAFNNFFTDIHGVAVCLDYTANPAEELDFDNFCLKPCPVDECVEAAAANVLCYHNGTTDPNDDYWTFDLTVSGGTPGGYWTAGPPINQSGPYGVPKVIYPGPISGGPVTFTITDSNDPNCQTTITVSPPPPCSDTCTLNFSYVISECNDNGTPGIITDDYYNITVTVTGTNGNAWMIKQKKLDGSEVLLASGAGDSTVVIGHLLTSDGDFTLWVFLSDYFDCIKDEFIKAPDNCSACLNATVLNKICYDNGTADPADDYWTFDIIVENGPGTFWTSTAPVATSAGYNVVKTLYPGLIANGPITFTIYDNQKPECRAILVVDPPKPCSEKCELEASVRAGQCVFERGQWVYYVTLNVNTNPGTCWMAKKKNSDGSEQVLGTYFGPQTIVLGPFAAGEDWTLWVMVCEQFDCVRDFYIDGPDCRREGLIYEKVKLDRPRVLLSPNPASNQLTVVSDIKTDGTYTIVNMQGRIVTTGKLSGLETTVDIKELPNGSYWMEVYLDDANVIRQLFIKAN